MQPAHIVEFFDAIVWRFVFVSSPSLKSGDDAASTNCTLLLHMVSFEIRCMK